MWGKLGRWSCLKLSVKFSSYENAKEKLFCCCISYMLRKVYGCCLLSFTCSWLSKSRIFAKVSHFARNYSTEKNSRRRHRNGKKLNQFQLLFDVCGGSPMGRRWVAGGSPAVEMNCCH